MTFDLLRRGQVCFPMHLYGKNVENFKRLLLWSLWANVAQISFGASLGQGNERLLKWLPSIDPGWLPCPYMVKHFKNFLLQNRGYLQAESSGMGGLPKLLKWWSYIDIWPFYGEVKFASVCICMDHIHLYGKNVENSYFGYLLYNPVELKLDDEH